MTGAAQEVAFAAPLCAWCVGAMMFAATRVEPMPPAKAEPLNLQHERGPALIAAALQAADANPRGLVINERSYCTVRPATLWHGTPACLAHLHSAMMGERPM